jgi:BatD DUF11 like domain
VTALHRLAAAILLAAAGGHAWAAEPAISARLTPGEIRLGERAQLSVTIANVQSAPAPALPSLDGITVQGVGQQMSMSIVNGETSVNVTHNYVLTPSRTGTLTIPALSVDVAGRRLSTDPLVLRVIAAGAPRSPPVRERQTAEPSAGEAATLEIAVPHRDLFVGEVVPARLVLRIREGLRVTEASQPVIDADAFAVTRKTDREPKQTTAVIAGARYVVVDFPIALSPVSAGDQRLGAHIDLRAIVPRTAQRGRGVFDDPFLGSFFGGLAGEQRKLEVVATPQTVRVRPLPDDGRPPDFAGAIGRFSLTASAEPTELAVGDPIAEKIVVSGSGNFDRVSLPTFDPGPDWKTYPESSAFAPDDELGLAGRKTFEQAIVPERVSLRELPARRFSFFDPEARRYVTLATDPIALTIAPAAGRSGSGAGAARSSSSRASGGEAFELAPNEIAPGDLVSGFRPIATRPWFLLAQIGPLAALAAASLWARRRDRRLADVSWQRARAARAVIRAQAAEMARAAAAGDRRVFFVAARRAVQEEIAARSDRTATALTLGEIEDCLPGAAGGDRAASRATGASGPLPAEGGTHADLLGEVRALFAEADRASYAGTAAGGADLDAWRERVLELIARLEAA